MDIHAIIFDADGVIIDSESLWDQVQREFLGRRGKKYDRERTKPAITGLSSLDTIHVMQAQYGFDGDPIRLAAERSRLASQLFQKKARFIRGFEQFHDLVKPQFRTCVATSLSKELLRVFDTRLRLYRRFTNHVYSIDDVGGLGKPHPAVFLYAAERLNTMPCSCVVIEDSPNGVQAAKRAGMYCIGLCTTHSGETLRNADVVVPSFDELQQEPKRFGLDVSHRL